MDYIARLNDMFAKGNTDELQAAVNEIERIRVVAAAFNAAIITPERHANNIKSCWAAINETSREYVTIGNEILSNCDGKNIDLDKVNQLFKASDKVYGAWNSMISYLRHEHFDDKDGNICFNIIEAIYHVAGRSNAERSVYCLLEAFVLHDDSLDI